MDKIELQKKLNQPYSTKNWQEVVQFVFPNVQMLNPPMVIPIDNDKVEQFRQLGNVQLHDGKSLALFELKLKENVNIIRNRVELNNIVSQYIDQDQTHGVLSIFEKGTDDYRFTFSARASEFDEVEGDFISKKTDTKRFTYVLGKNESCKTPAQRFYDLSTNKSKAEIKDIENAFSVEKLSKAFFKEYKDQYTAFVNYMMQTPGIFTAIYSQDDKAIRDFVKILLGRIIFIKFVQKKGWMGVAASSTKWQEGDYRFLENAFEKFQHKGLFYSTFLEPLFDALDESNRPNDIFKVTNTRVPYLSGGLFELEDKKTKNINFPAKYFNDLFEFLDRYNFTIDENDTNDHEVGIDPEMLGHIFENLLEDNKDKGAFYTPKEIVRYMCQESLKEYLKTSLENHKQWPSVEAEAKDFEQALHNFVAKKEAGGIIEFEETIAKALKEVKICDPAIGSGAFPMGLLNEIFQLVHKLHEVNSDKVERVWELKGWQPNLVKQNIIKYSIYGVDIEKGAVDVARLRFWLSLIVDEPEPKALPHLDYKIVVGNSLVSKLDDTIIDIDWEVQNDNYTPETDLFGKPKPKQFNAFEVENDEKQKQLLKEISAKQKLVFDPNSDEEKLSLQIRNLKIDLLVNQLDAMVKTKGVAKEPTGTSKNIKAQTDLWLQTLGWKQQIEKLQKLKKDPNGILHFFDWKLDFPEIMNEQVAEKVGFDIVIGNPPYIEFKKLPDSDKKTFTHYKTASRKYDIFGLFIELTVKLLKNNGVHSFINPTTFLMKDFGSPIRKIISDNFRILEIVDFADYQIFDTAITYTGIFIYVKDSIHTNYSFTYQKLIGSEKASDRNLLFSSKESNKYKISSEITSDKLIVDSWIFGNLENELIMSKIELNQNLKKYTKYTFQGIATGKDEVFLITNQTRLEYKIENEIIYPILKGKDVKKYSIDWSNNYIFYPYDKLTNKVISELDFKTNYPNAYSYFMEKRELLKGRSYFDKSNKLWFELWCERSLSKFLEIKIVNAEISPENRFQIDKSGILGNTKIFSTVLKDEWSEYYFTLLAILNSSLLNYYHKKIASPKAGGFFDYKTQYIQKYPIKFPKNKLFFDAFINEILEKKLQNLDTTDLEQQIDNLVYKLYELTYEEVLVVEPAFSERMSREEYEGLKVE